MKTTPPPPPASMSVRFSCRAVRLWSAVADAAPSSSRHVAGCAECRAHFAAIAALDARLRHGARATPAAAPAADSPRAGFENDLLRAVRQARAEAAAAPAALPRRRVGPAVWTTAAACAAIAVALLVADRTATRNSAALAADTAAVTQAVRSVSARLVETVIPAAGLAAVDNPLQHELGAAAADMRSVLDFLAMNFLPRSG